MNRYFADDFGYFGDFGGAYVPELLYNNINELATQYKAIITTDAFQSELNNLLKNYVGRPSPLYLAERLSKKHGCQIYLKREDLNHTGAHKINNALGQALLAKRLGKTTLIAETGAGQHGVAVATAAALLNMPCQIFMGAKDTSRQSANVSRMKLLGASVTSVTAGSQTLKDATNEALRYWTNHASETHYLIGSVVGPHPYPTIVAHFQSVISLELQRQISQPTAVLAAVGGGSNAMGAFYHYINDRSVRLIAVEAGGDGKRSAASISHGTPGVLHGALTMILQDQDGQISEAHSISAGLDYPGVGPQLAHLAQTKRIEVLYVTDESALGAGRELARLEGILPALESAHALAAIPKLQLASSDTLVICLSGRGDKDLEIYNFK